MDNRERKPPQTKPFEILKPKANPLIQCTCFIIEVLAQDGVFEQIEGRKILPFPIAIDKAGSRWQLEVSEQDQGNLGLVRMITLKDPTQTLTLLTKEEGTRETGELKERIIGAAYRDEAGELVDMGISADPTLGEIITGLREDLKR